MDPRNLPSEAELARMLDEEREAAGPAPESPARRGPARDRKRFEGALPLEDFLREIEDGRG